MADNQVKVIITGDNQAGSAFTQVAQQLDQLSSRVAEFGKQLVAALAIEEVTRRIVEFGSQALESAASLAHMSERTGIAVDQLAGLAYAANLSGVGTETLEKGVKKLQATLEAAASGNDKATHSLTALGISAVDSNGKVIQADVAIQKIADRFVGLSDGTEKAALAMQVFGARTGTQLIPLLNLGSDGIKKLSDEAEKFGLKLKGDASDNVLLLHQNMSRLKAMSEGLAVQFVSGAAPALNAVAKALTNVTGGTDLASKAGEEFGKWVKEIFVGLASIVVSAELAYHKLELLSNIKWSLELGNFKGASEDAKKFFGVIDDSVTENLLQKFEKFKQDLSAAVTDKPIKPPKPLTPTTKEDLGTDAVAKARLKAEMDDAQQSASFQKSMNDLEQKNLDELYKHELISVGDYFDKKKQLQLDSLDAEAGALNQEIKLQAAGVAALEQKIASQSKDTAGKKEANKLLVEQINLQDQLNKNVDKLRVIQAQQDELQHKNADGTINDLSAQAEQMERTGAQAQRLAQRIDDIYAVLQEQIARVTVAEKNHELTATEAQDKINSLNAQGVQELAGMIQRYNDLAQASGDPKLIVNAEKLTTKLDELGKKADWVSDQIINNAQTSFENLFTGILDGSKTAAQSFADFGKSILQSIDQIIAKMLAMKIISSLMPFLSPIFGGGSIAGAVAGAAAGGGIDWSTFGLPGHAMGGDVSAGSPIMVGELGPEVFMPSSAGTIIPNSQLGAGGGGGSTVTVNINMDARGADQAAARSMALTLQRFKGQIIQETMSRISDRQLRR